MTGCDCALAFRTAAAASLVLCSASATRLSASCFSATFFAASASLLSLATRSFSAAAAVAAAAACFASAAFFSVASMACALSISFLFSANSLSTFSRRCFSNALRSSSSLLALSCCICNSSFSRSISALFRIRSCSRAAAASAALCVASLS